MIFFLEKYICFYLHNSDNNIQTNQLSCKICFNFISLLKKTNGKKEK